MRGIILAAGKGSRLNGTIGDKPKCLLRVGGKTLVERQIDALKAVGITDIVAGRRLPGRRGAAELWRRASPTSRTRASRKPTASIRCGWHDLCYMTAS